jgi:hypothetical protein
MNTTFVAREVESSPSQDPKTHLPHRSDACRRCGGLLVDEHCMNGDGGKTEKEYWAKRCVQCGDVIDEIILRNRYVPRHTFQKRRSSRRLVIGVRCHAAA